MPAERRAARAGGGRRGPVPGLRREAGKTRAGSPVAVRYADDVVVLCHTQEQAAGQGAAGGVAGARGLAFNEDKTRIVHLSEGFDFLGFNVRRYRCKLLIKPSQGGHQAGPGTARVRNAHPARRATRWRSSPRLNPIIRGWAAYYRGVVSSRLFGAWIITCGTSPTSGPHGATTTSRNAGSSRRYFGKFNKFRNDHWVFGDRDSGAYLVKFSWTAIERHVPVKGAASPDDPALASYWAERRKKVKPPLDRYTLRLLSRQDGLARSAETTCSSADQPPQSPEQWERWWLQVTRKAIAASYLTHNGRPGPADDDQTRLVHASCQRALHARQRRKPPLQPATPSRLA